MIESCWNANPRFRPDMYVLVSNLAEKLTEDAAVSSILFTIVRTCELTEEKIGV